MIFAILFLGIMLGLCIVILLGRGDMLIAGYNTASDERRQKVHIKRLRLVVSAVALLSSIAVVYPFLAGRESDLPVMLASTFAVVPIAIAGLILTHTWCVKK